MFYQNISFFNSSERGVTVDNSREASVLYVTSVTSSDEGNYTCVPSNASPASVTVHVVHSKYAISSLLGWVVHRGRKGKKSLNDG